MMKPHLQLHRARDPAYKALSLRTYFLHSHAQKSNNILRECVSVFPLALRVAMLSSTIMFFMVRLHGLRLALAKTNVLRCSSHISSHPLYWRFGICWEMLLCTILTLLGYIPGVIYGLCTVICQRTDGEMAKQK